MSNFTIEWQAPANIGLLPQHPDDGQQSFFSIGWIVKQQATWYPYDATALTVASGAGPDAPDGGGETPTPAGGGDGGTVTGAGDTTPAPSPQIRARIAKANVAARKDPGLFRKKGLTFALSLEAPATVTAVLVTSSGKKLTYSQTRKVAAGTDHLTLRPSEYGKLATRRSKKVAAKLVVTIKYTDKSTGTVTKSISLAAPPKK
ncbi:hypothetical protein [Baekduia sp. Peel2402]|uniref:hypothetical protein n=1 Tax=Baekduia sp. Peel2402 TaxID=3458296 RepID=UPI00403EE2D0